jgi:hypothetical protein
VIIDESPFERPVWIGSDPFCETLGLILCSSLPQRLLSQQSCHSLLVYSLKLALIARYRRFVPEKRRAVSPSWLSHCWTAAFLASLSARSWPLILLCEGVQYKEMLMFLLLAARRAHKNWWFRHWPELTLFRSMASRACWLLLKMLACSFPETMARYRARISAMVSPESMSTSLVGPARASFSLLSSGMTAAAPMKQLVIFPIRSI